MFEMAKPENNWDFSTIRKDMMVFRNLISCESHCDILRNCMLIIEEKREKTAGEYCSKIEDMRSPAWLKLPGCDL